MFRSIICFFTHISVIVLNYLIAIDVIDLLIKKLKQNANNISK